MRWDLAVTYEKTGGGAETMDRRVDPDAVLDSMLFPPVDCGWAFGPPDC